MFEVDDNDLVSLMNVRKQPERLVSYADVYEGESYLDSSNCLVLDYRNDTTAVGYNKNVLKRVRDEMREIRWRDKSKTRIYLGRVNVFLWPITGGVYNPKLYNNPDLFFFYSNFLLDFRSEVQNSQIPEWVLNQYEQ
jgi:hypothetical protein